MRATLLRLIRWCLGSSALLGAVLVRGESPQSQTAPPPCLKRPGEGIPARVLPNRQTEDAAAILECFKVASDGDLLLLPVELRGKRYAFALDTGASHGLYDSSLRPILGEPIKRKKTKSPDPVSSVPVFRSPAGMVGKLALPVDSECFCMDLEGLRAASGHDINGLVGMDFLKKYVIRIDFDQGEVRFLRRVGGNAGARIPIEFKGNYPYIRVAAQGLMGRGSFLVDTGCGGFISGNLQREPFEDLSRLGFLNIQGRGGVVNLLGSQTSRYGCVSEIRLESFRHQKLVFREAPRNLLGLGYWSRYVVTFDFPNSVMYLKKGRQFDRPELRDRSGLDIRRTKGNTLVASVEAGSPSAVAGIKPQDLLLKIDGVEANQLSLWSIRREFCQPGKDHRLRIRRGEKEIEISLHSCER